MTDVSAEAVPYRSIWTHLMRVPFTQGYVDAGGIRTRYIRAGKPGAPKLIMLHGTASTWECFSANIEAHAEHFDCYAFDLVGSGFTDKPDKDYEIGVYVDHVIAVMDALDIAQASVLGVSLGAWVAGRFAVEHPSRVEKLILIAPSGLIVNAATMGQIRSRRTAAVENPTWEAITTIFTGIIYAEHNRLPDLIAVRQATYREPGMKEAMLHILCLQDPEIRTRNLIAEDDWRKITSQTLVIAAPDDNPDYYNTAYKLLELIPDIRLVEIPKVKHWAHFEESERFNTLSLAFLKGEQVADAVTRP
jgi:2-hydroxy-6-oxonona-2,4-dienedioate hydrolase